MRLISTRKATPSSSPAATVSLRELAALLCSSLSSMGEESSTSSTPLLPRHQNQTYGNEEEQKESAWSGDYVKSIVYAGLDAIVTSFSLISSISAGHLSSVDVLVLGFANLIADGISMGIGDFVSSSTERDMAERVRATTINSASERTQQSHLLHTYQSLGMSLDDARTIVAVFAKYKDIMADEQMMTGKGMLPPSQSEKPWKSGMITFLAFIVFGSAPLLSFIVLIPFTDSDRVKFIGGCLLSALSLGLLGAAKARISGQRYWYSMGVTLMTGCVAAACAYGIGWTLRNVAGLQD